MQTLSLYPTIVFCIYVFALTLWLGVDAYVDLTSKFMVIIPYAATIQL